MTAARRKALIADERRDIVKVFLMTSSGARGVSFPKTDWIIALIPRFGIEAALMEVAQLIYRGRGKHYKGDDGIIRDDGDWKDRHLIICCSKIFCLKMMFLNLVNGSGRSVTY